MTLNYGVFKVVYSYELKFWLNNLLLQDAQTVFSIAIFTSWISPSTVWSNNFQYKSYFLIISRLELIYLSPL